MVETTASLSGYAWRALDGPFDRDRWSLATACDSFGTRGFVDRLRL